jgi:hypothetical protein
MKENLTGFQNLSGLVDEIISVGATLVVAP